MFPEFSPNVERVAAEAAKRREKREAPESLKYTYMRILQR